MKTLLSLIFLFVAFGSPCEARHLKRWIPEQLLNKADVVVVGHVESVASVPRRENEDSQVLGERFSLSYFEALIVVKVIIKGEKITEKIKLRFSRAIPNTQLITDPPMCLSIKPKQLCVFYLVSGKEGAYLNVLHDEVDQDMAVKYIGTK